MYVHKVKKKNVKGNPAHTNMLRRHFCLFTHWKRLQTNVANTYFQIQYNKIKTLASLITNDPSDERKRWT